MKRTKDEKQVLGLEQRSGNHMLRVSVGKEKSHIEWYDKLLYGARHYRFKAKYDVKLVQMRLNEHIGHGLTNIVLDQVFFLHITSTRT